MMLLAKPVKNIPNPNNIPATRTTFFPPCLSTMGPHIIIPTGTMAKEILNARDVSLNVQPVLTSSKAV